MLAYATQILQTGLILQDKFLIILHSISRCLWSEEPLMTAFFTKICVSRKSNFSESQDYILPNYHDLNPVNTVNENSHSVWRYWWVVWKGLDDNGPTTHYWQSDKDFSRRCYRVPTRYHNFGSLGYGGDCDCPPIHDSWVFVFGMNCVSKHLVSEQDSTSAYQKYMSHTWEEIVIDGYDDRLTQSFTSLQIVVYLLYSIWHIVFEANGLIEHAVAENDKPHLSLVVCLGRRSFPHSWWWLEADTHCGGRLLQNDDFS